MRSTEHGRFNRRLKILVGLLVGSALIWIGVRSVQPSGADSVALTTDEFTAIPSVFHVTARPPSLFVELNAQEWSRMTDRDRIEALEAIGRIAGRAGYSGVHARTEDGSAGGQWFPRSGADLLEKPGRRT